MRVKSCECCEIANSKRELGALVAIGTHWTANVRTGHERPGVVVQTTAHRASLADLTRGESATLGAAIEGVFRLMMGQPGVRRVHVNYWNEADNGHVHFHLIPVFVDDETTGPALKDELTEAGSVIRFDEMLLALQGDSLWRSYEPSKLVRAALRVTIAWQRVSTYRLTKRLAGERGEWAGFDAAEMQVMAWLVVLVATWAAVGTWGSWTWLAGLAFILAGYRLVDMTFYEIRILLSRDPVQLRSVPRALLLRVLNVAEVFTVSAIAASVAMGGALRPSLRVAYNTIALQPPFGLRGLWIDVLLAICALASLLLAAGGIALLVSVSAQRFGEL